MSEIPKIAQAPEIVATGNRKEQIHGPPKCIAAEAKLTHLELVLIYQFK